VSGIANESKGDRGPESWRSVRAEWCDYAVRYVRVARRVPSVTGPSPRAGPPRTSRGGSALELEARTETGATWAQRRTIVTMATVTDIVDAAASNPPVICPYGHELGADRVLVGWEPCQCPPCLGRGSMLRGHPG
jgi:hypothetical protein